MILGNNGSCCRIRGSCINCGKLCAKCNNPYNRIRGSCSEMQEALHRLQRPWF